MRGLTHGFYTGRSRGGRGGYGLLDAMLAILIASMAGVVACGMLLAASLANKSASDYSTALSVAREEVEILRTRRPFLMSNCTSAPFVGSVPQLNDLTSGTGTLSIADYPGVSGLKQITITVSWRARPSNSARSFTLTTLSAAAGLGK